MHLNQTLKDKKGVTIIELLIALVIGALLIGALYRTFIGQQKTYIIQEQVVDMQQNVRAAINRMMREIRMAGFGNIESVLSLPGGVNGFTQPITAATNSITIVGGFKQIRRDNGDPITVDSASGNTVILDYTPNANEFNTEKKRFISIGGLESSKFEITGKILTLDNALKVNHPKGTPIFKVQAITYNLNLSNGTLQRDENTGGSGQPLAENIENLQFEYFDANGNLLPLPVDNPAAIRMVRVTVTAKTDFQSGDGFRRRTITSNIYVRNMGISQ